MAMGLTHSAASRSNYLSSSFAASSASIASSIFTCRSWPFSLQILQLLDRLADFLLGFAHMVMPFLERFFCVLDLFHGLFLMAIKFVRRLVEVIIRIAQRDLCMIDFSHVSAHRRAQRGPSAGQRSMRSCTKPEMYDDSANSYCSPSSKKIWQRRRTAGRLLIRRIISRSESEQRSICGYPLI